MLAKITCIKLALISDALYTVIVGQDHTKFGAPGIYTSSIRPASRQKLVLRIIPN